MAEFSPQTLRRLQLTELEILKVLDAFCKEHQITYFIDSGTLLGAVRHAGFIPWDDDMDCGMLREDYDRFVELAEQGLPEGYSLHTAKNTPGFAGTFAKIYKDGTRFETKETQEAGCAQGIFVDIFPYDTLAADPKERARQMSECGRAQKLLYLHTSKTITVPFKGALGAAAKLGCRVAHYAVHAATTAEKLQDDFDRGWHFEGEASEDTCIMCYPEGGTFPKNMLVPTKTAWFEGVELPCPADPEGYLNTLYGENWSQLPPEEDRRTHMPVVLDFGDGE